MRNIRLRIELENAVMAIPWTEKIGMSIEDFQEYCRAYDFLKDRKETVTAYGKAVTLTYRKVGGEKYDFEYFYFINEKLSSIHK
jgi:hypothetical protein